MTGSIGFTSEETQIAIEKVLQESGITGDQMEKFRLLLDQMICDGSVSALDDLNVNEKLLLSSMASSVGNDLVDAMSNRCQAPTRNIDLTQGSKKKSDIFKPAALDNLIDELFNKPKTTQTRIPDHWRNTHYRKLISEALDDALRSITMEDKKVALRDAINAVLFEDVTIKSQVTSIARYSTLKRYFHCARDNIMDILGPRSVSPEIEAMLPTTTFEKLKSFVKKKRANDNAYFDDINNCVLIKDEEIDYDIPESAVGHDLTPLGRQVRIDTNEHSAENPREAIARILDYLHKPKREKLQFFGSSTELRGVIADRLSGRHEDQNALVKIVHRITEIQSILRKSNITSQNVLAAYEMCNAAIDLENAQITDV